MAEAVVVPGAALGGDELADRPMEPSGCLIDHSPGGLAV
jgi:hypothetical protein